MHRHLSPPPRKIALEDAFDDRTVFLPDMPGISSEVDVLPQRAGQSERSFHLGCLVEQSLLLVSDEVVQDLLERSGVSGREQGQPRNSHESLPQQAGVHPRESGCDFFLSVSVLDKQIGAMDQLVVVRSDARSLGHKSVEMTFQSGRIHLCDRCGEHHGVSLLHVNLEMTRDIKVLLAVETSSVLV